MFYRWFTALAVSPSQAQISLSPPRCVTSATSLGLVETGALPVQGSAGPQPVPDALCICLRAVTRLLFRASESPGALSACFNPCCAPPTVLLLPSDFRAPLYRPPSSQSRTYKLAVAFCTRLRVESSLKSRSASGCLSGVFKKRVKRSRSGEISPP